MKNDPKYYKLADFSAKPGIEQEALLVDSLSEGKIFLDKSGETALYILNKVPGAIKYLRARY